ncbi:PH domain-containing protein [Niallia sp. 01092]|uniref:PH domain-containing protein n=1 Tax=unclassified Niallia TaxID=2837522 RepID=UPI003FD66AD7
MFEPKKLHPVTIVFNILKQLKDIIFPFLAVIIVGGSASKWDSYYNIGIICFGIITIISGILSWFFFTYHLQSKELRIEHGIFVKKKRYIPFERIQSIDFTEGILHRPFRLVKVKIETAGGANEAEAILTAISKENAEQLREYINKDKNRSVNRELSGELQQEETRQELYKMNKKELLLLATTSGGVGVVFSAIIATVSQFDDFIPYKKLFQEFQHIVANSVAIITFLVFLVFLVLWIISLMMTMLKYANFTVSKVGDDLVITRGLLEKKQITIPLHRIQAVKITENVIRQPFRLATVHLESAGGSLSDNEASSVAVLPIIKKEKMKKILGVILPDYHITDALHTPPKFAAWRYIFRNSWIALPVIAASLFFFPVWGWLSIILLVILPFWGYLNYRAAGWHLAQKQLTISFRHLGKITLIMRKNRIQTLGYKEGFLQKRVDLASLHAIAASGVGGSGGTVSDLPIEDVKKVYSWYSYSKKE